MVLIVFNVSCGHPDWSSPEESSVNTSSTVVEVPSDFLGDCQSGTEGDKSFTVTITVDIYQNNQYQENYYTHVYQRNNNSLDYDNFRFDNIEVPESGSYIVSITYTTNDCYVCCNNGSCTATDITGSTWNGGYPYFRGIKFFQNTNTVPDVIYIQPTKICF